MGEKKGGRVTTPWPPHLVLPALRIHWQTAVYLGNRQSLCKRLIVYALPPELYR